MTDFNSINIDNQLSLKSAARKIFKGGTALSVTAGCMTALGAASGVIDTGQIGSIQDTLGYALPSALLCYAAWLPVAWLDRAQARDGLSHEDENIAAAIDIFRSAVPETSLATFSKEKGAWMVEDQEAGTIELMTNAQFQEFQENLAAKGRDLAVMALHVTPATNRAQLIVETFTAGVMNNPTQTDAQAAVTKLDLDTGEVSGYGFENGRFTGQVFDRRPHAELNEGVIPQPAY